MKRNKILKCKECNSVISVLFDNGINLDCCNGKFEELVEQTADSTTEKHVPIIEKIEGGYKVTVGSTIHPMTDAHLIQWVELIADGVSYIKYFNPGDEPVAIFNIEAKEVQAREYCNLHGLWLAEHR